jgi:hypothetical protein
MICKMSINEGWHFMQSWSTLDIKKGSLTVTPSCYVFVLYGFQDQSFSHGGGKNFHFSMSRAALGHTQLPIQWVLGALSLGVKQLGCEIDHTPPASAKVQKTWVYTSTPPYVFMA